MTTLTALPTAPTLWETTHAVTTQDGNLSQVQDPLLHTTSYTYDGANELTKVTHPDGSADTTGYDLNGNVTSQGVLDTTGATIRTTNYSYDPLNQLQSQTDPSSKTGWASSDVIGSSEVLGASPPLQTEGRPELHRHLAASSGAALEDLQRGLEGGIAGAVAADLGHRILE